MTQLYPKTEQLTQARRFLSLLGYKDGEFIHFGGFLPLEVARTKKDKGRKAQAKYPNIPADLANWEREGRGIYAVVNKGGSAIADITEGVALFYEHDQLDKETSAALWQGLGLPEPTFQVDTGGKSIHSYWVLSESVSPQDWRALQTDLLEFADADRSLKNQNRVMRLPGFKHAGTGVICKIINCSEFAYSYAELRAIVPKQETKSSIAMNTPVIAPRSFDDDRAFARELLSYIPRRQPGSNTYDESFKVLAALVHKFGQNEGLRIAREWSPDTDWGEDLERKVRSLRGGSNPVTFGTLVKIAEQNGYRRPVTSEAWPERPKTLKEAQASQVSQGNGYAELRLALTAALALEDPVEREIQYQRIKDEFRLPIGLIRRVITELTRVRSNIKDTYTLADFEALNSTGINFLIPRFLPEVGLTCLGGYSGDGKSRLMYDMIAALIKQRPFLGFTPTKKCKVLLIQQEEFENTIQNSLEGVGLLFDDTVDKDALVIKKSWEIDDVSKFELWLSEVKPDVVFIDSFRAVNRSTGINENSPEAASLVYQIQSILHQRRISGVMIHHTTKNKEATGLQRLGGSSGIPGACDDYILMSRLSENPNDGKRLLSLGKRNLHGRFTVEMSIGEFPCFGWEMIGEAGEDAESISLQDRVLAAIKNNSPRNPDGITAAFLKECLGLDREDKTIYKALSTLTQSKVLSCTRLPSDKRVRLYSLPSACADASKENGYFLPETYAQQRLEKVSTYSPKVSQDTFWGQNLAKGADPIAHDGNVARYRQNAAPALPVRNPSLFQLDTKKSIQDTNLEYMDTFCNPDTARDAGRKYPSGQPTFAHAEEPIDWDDDDEEVDPDATVTFAPGAEEALLRVVDQTLPYPHRREIPLTEGHPEWHTFEAALIAAKTMDQLIAAKQATPEQIRVDCMEQWRADGRYEWLTSKVKALS